MLWATKDEDNLKTHRETGYPGYRAGLRTRLIFNRVQEIFASPSSSSNSKKFFFRVQVRVRQKRSSSSSSSANTIKFEFTSLTVNLFQCFVKYVFKAIRVALKN